MTRLFSENEANAMLPVLVPLLEELRTVVRQISDFRSRLAAITGAARMNGHAAEALALEKSIRERGDRFSRLVAELHGLGVELKDVNTGLIDFRSLRDGREVYLCWCLGEERIRFWHKLDTGFRGRQSL
ncbi:MAG: DUF2203 domain-containing protein [Chloroflexi bacterium]|nr:DUF2203 domain-containing protein [Chloroflexota bacterium]